MNTARMKLPQLLAATFGVVIASVAPAFAQTPTGPAKVEDTMAQRMQACVACHGKEGRATPEGYFPRIAGKPAGYLFNQLVNFRDGRRSNPIMGYLVEHLNDDYLRDIANHFASLDLPYASPASASASASAAVASQGLQRGFELVTKGDTARAIPACASCHGERLTGAQPAIPGLLGLSRDYLLAQIGAWRVGVRKASAPDCMATIARRLTPEDVSAVTAWLASRTVPPDAKAPAAATPRRAPLECGSGWR
jgi:cytochrome c553